MTGGVARPIPNLLQPRSLSSGEEVKGESIEFVIKKKTYKPGAGEAYQRCEKKSRYRDHCRYPKRGSSAKKAARTVKGISKGKPFRFRAPGKPSGKRAKKAKSTVSLPRRVAGKKNCRSEKKEVEGLRSVWAAPGGGKSGSEGVLRPSEEGRTYSKRKKKNSRGQKERGD